MRMVAALRVMDLPTRWRFAAAGVLALSCPVSRSVFARWGRAFFPAYRDCSKALMGVLATLSSVAPFALWDLGVVVLVVVAVVDLVRRLRTHRPVLPWLSTVCLVLATTLALLVDGWALNHYAPPLSQELDLAVSTYSVDELAEATEFYLLEAAQRADQVPRTKDGSLAEQDFFELARIAGASYAGLAQEYELFRGPTVPVKALLLWGEPLLYSGHTGIFWAATGESSVPLRCADADKPFIMCHEAAHRLGLASEQEANFAAFLACTTSDDMRFAYAGYYNAFAYCFNALYSYDPEGAVALLQQTAEGEEGVGVVLVWSDRVATSAHYDAYEGTFEKVGSTVNDHYLKGFGESAGVRSYGLVVDYLIAWHQAPSH